MQWMSWLKRLALRVYRRAVYCQTCGYEIGSNPECPACRKRMKP